MIDKFEPILLKSLTHNGQFFGKAMPIIKSKHFTEIGDQELFKLIKEYYGEYKNIPSLTELVAKVKNVSNEEIRKQIITSLQKINSVEEVKNIDFMLDETVSWVRESMYHEAIMLGADALTKKDENLKLKAQKVMDEMAKVTVDSDLGLDFDDIDEMIEYYSERQSGIKTQHKQLNYRLGPGFLPGTLSLLMAASGVGKSLLMTDLISGMIKKNKNILLVSLEMADKEIMKRVHANAMDLPINSLLDLNKTEGELKKIRNGDSDRPGRDIVTKDMIISAYNKMKTEGNVGKFFVKDFPAGSFSPLMLEQLVESYKIEKNIEFDIVFVDYLGIMKSDLLSPSAGLYSYIKSIAEELRASAKKLNVPIVSASQLNRGSIGNVDDADNSNVSDSIGSVMTADFIMFLLQNEEMKDKKEIVCKITKNRFAGKTDTWMMNIDYDKMRFTELVVQSPIQDVQEITGIGVDSNPINDDFVIITAEKQKSAEEFADQEIKDIARDDINKIKEHDKKDPFTNDMDQLYKDLGL